MSDNTPVRLPEDYFSQTYVSVVTFLTNAALKAAYGFRHTGAKNCPPTGPVIIAPNHACFLDPPLVTNCVGRDVYYLASARLFKPAVFGPLIRKLGAVPVDLGRNADKAAYEAALRLLQRERAICLYPEGTRTWDGKLGPLKPGVGRLAVATGAPILPVAIHGGFKAWPRTKKFPRIFTRITADVLPPIIPRETQTAPERRQEAQRLMAELERVLRQALGEPPAPATSHANLEQTAD